jgi:type I restriction enzyme S subunit
VNRMWGVRLGDIVEVTMGQAPTGDTYNEEGVGLPLIAGAGDFGDATPTVKKFTSRPTKVCRSGDIVMSIRATIGTKVVADRQYCLGRGVAGLRAGKAIDPRYLWHWLTQNERDLSSKGRGATFPQVSRSDITDMALDLPRLDEQRRIAAILDKADALRQKRKRAIALLDSLTQSIFMEMFEDVTVSEVRALGDVCTLIRDGAHATPTYVESGVPFVTVRNIVSGSVDLSNVKYVSPETHADLTKRAKPERGDILV